jgi:hypothetical protein
LWLANNLTIAIRAGWLRAFAKRAAKISFSSNSSALLNAIIFSLFYIANIRYVFYQPTPRYKFYVFFNVQTHEAPQVTPPEAFSVY